MINTRPPSVLLLPPVRAEDALHAAARRLAHMLAEGGLPVHVAALPPEAGFARRLWRLRGLVNRYRPGIVLSCAEEDHLLTAALPGRAPRRLWLQAHLPGWRTEAAARRFWRLLPRISGRARLIAATPAVRDRLAHTAGLPKGVVAHLPPPVELPEPWPRVTAAALRGREPVILFPGPLERTSQPGLLVKALARLRPEPAKLALPAAGPQLKPVRYMLESLGLTNRVIWLETAEDWPRWLEKARVLCWPARIAPLADHAVRALAAGLPVVGARVAGLEAVLRANPEAGALVPETDAEALARALSRWLANPGEPAPRQALAREWTAESLLPRWRALLAGLA